MTYLGVVGPWRTTGAARTWGWTSTSSASTSATVGLAARPGLGRAQLGLAHRAPARTRVQSAEAGGGSTSSPCTATWLRPSTAEPFLPAPGILPARAPHDLHAVFGAVEFLDDSR